MRRSPRIFLSSAVLLLGLACCAGCGNPFVKVRGEVLVNGKPLPLPPGVTLSVEFSSAGDGGVGVGTIADAKAEATGRAVAAGAAPETIQIVDVEDVPLAYLPGNATRIRIKAVGDLAMDPS